MDKLHNGIDPFVHVGYAGLGLWDPWFRSLFRARIWYNCLVLRVYTRVLVKAILRSISHHNWGANHFMRILRLTVGTIPIVSFPTAVVVCCSIAAFRLLRGIWYNDLSNGGRIGFFDR